ncbi:hypothetical protein Fcan01_22523 [Folsomia candida]|uniref:Uncharacterized protein n=1 Tax=Folsomia candida TaxID=158441 RepID=A0A226DDB7_FOLCA|nr:hypothetical protein Fcan01_22523 [Folsomia candida]
MANQQQIIQQLTDYTRFGFQIIPPPHIPELDNIWQWQSNGLPVFESLLRPWERFVPNGITDQRLINGLTGNDQQFIIVCTGTMKRDLLSSLLMEDVKKIDVRSSGSNLIITKTAIPLIPFDNSYRQRSLRVIREMDTKRKSVPELILEVNLNAARGFYGPGTFRCRHSNCTVTGPCISQSPNSTQWGPLPHQRLEVRKRYLCSSNNNVYLIHCAACVASGIWSTYVGSSHNDTNFHKRCSTHPQKPCDQQMQISYPRHTLISTIIRRLNGDEADHDNFLQDPFVHFNFVHNPNDRRYTIIEGNFPTRVSMLRCEEMYKYVCGNFVYDPLTHSGALNKFY